MRNRTTAAQWLIRQKSKSVAGILLRWRLTVFEGHVDKVRLCVLGCVLIHTRAWERERVAERREDEVRDDVAVM